jgi:hypothetical protein
VEFIIYNCWILDKRDACSLCLHLSVGWIVWFITCFCQNINHLKTTTNWTWSTVWRNLQTDLQKLQTQFKLGTHSLSNWGQFACELRKNVPIQANIDQTCNITKQKHSFYAWLKSQQALFHETKRANALKQFLENLTGGMVRILVLYINIYFISE